MLAFAALLAVVRRDTESMPPDEEWEFPELVIRRTRRMPADPAYADWDRFGLEDSAVHGLFFGDSRRRRPPAPDAPKCSSLKHMCGNPGPCPGGCSTCACKHQASKCVDTGCSPTCCNPLTPSPTPPPTPVPPTPLPSPAPGNICTGNSTQLPADQCNAWIKFHDSMGGKDWNHCSANRLDPCSCRYQLTPTIPGPFGTFCGAGGTTVVQV